MITNLKKIIKNFDIFKSSLLVLNELSALTPKICTLENFSVTFDDFWTLKMRNDSPNGG